MSADSSLHNQLENTLRGLSTLIKAVKFYPTGHPALTQALTRQYQEMIAALQGRPQLQITVQKDCLLYAGNPVAPGNPALKKLAHFLFSRRVEEILILQELKQGDLEAFARTLTLEPEEIMRRKGLPAILAEEGIATIWINEKDLSRIAEARQQIRARRVPNQNEPPQETPAEEQPAAAPPRPRPAPRLHMATVAEDGTVEVQKLEALFREIEKSETDDERFSQLARELAPLLRQEATGGRARHLLHGIALLGRTSQNAEVSAKKRDAAAGTLLQIANRDVLDFLYDRLTGVDIGAQTGQRVQNLLPFLGEPAAQYLADRLAEEGNAKIRKILTRTLTQFESTALPALSRLLRDERWYVARNAVAILGEIRDPERVPQLTVFLGHPDLRVRREAIRALTRIGSDEAMAVLLVAMEDGDRELQRQALLFLGALKQHAAVPHLQVLIERPDPFLRRAGLTGGAVQALGEIGDPQARGSIAALLARRRLWRRRRYDDIRAAAAEALGKIGNWQDRGILEEAAGRGPEKVTRAANRALRELAAREPAGQKKTE